TGHRPPMLHRLGVAVVAEPIALGRPPMRTMSPWRLVAVLAIFALGGLLTHVVLADSAPQQADPSVSAFTVRSSGAQQAIKTIASDDASTTTSTSFTTLSSASIVVPAGHYDEI